ncbi:hypothetical protein [Bradyrhizobium sp. RDT46]|uniref:hypothetical protein n=1 Tax=Bradyrhizobium sp. RDT46 TaxID=3341829 RepID=UPI0035C6ABCF
MRVIGAESSADLRDVAKPPPSGTLPIDADVGSSFATTFFPARLYRYDAQIQPVVPLANKTAFKPETPAAIQAAARMLAHGRSRNFMFHNHHILLQHFAGHPAIRFLRGRFEVDAIRNRMNLPSTQGWPPI